MTPEPGPGIVAAAMPGSVASRAVNAPRSRRQVMADVGFGAAAALGGAVLILGARNSWRGPPDEILPPAWVTTARVGVIVLAGFGVQLLLRIWRGAPVRFWTRMRALLVAVVVGWLAFLFTDQPFHVRRVAVAMGSALAGFALLCLLARPLAKLLHTRAWGAIDVALTLACLTTLGLELGLRAAAAVWNSPVLLRADAGVAEMLARFRFPAGHVRFGFPCNARGHYDEEFVPKEEGVPLVVNIGDSFAQGIVPHYYHYTTALERLLPPARVHNLGMPSIGPAEYLHLLRTEALPLQPDLIVVSLFVGNDIAQQSQARHPLLASWFNREYVQIAVVPTRIARMFHERRRLGRNELGIVGEQSVAKSDLSAVLRRCPWFLDPSLEPSTASDEGFLRIERVRATDVFQPAHTQRYVRFFELIDEIVTVAGAVPVTFLIIPDAFQVDDALWQRVVASVPRAELERDLAQRLLREHFEARGYRYLDLLPSFRAVSLGSDGQRHLYQRNDTHINVRGNLRAAAAMAAPVARQLGLAPAPALHGRTVEMVFVPGAAAEAAGELAVWLPGHTTVTVAVAAGEDAATVAARLASALTGWGVPARVSGGPTITIPGVPHTPALVGIAVRATAPGLDVSLVVPMVAPWPSPPGLMALPVGAGAVTLEALGGEGTGAQALEGVRDADAVPDWAAAERTPRGGDVAWTLQRAFTPRWHPAVDAQRLRVRLSPPGSVFVDVPVVEFARSKAAGFAPRGQPPPRLTARAPSRGQGAELLLRTDHAGAHVLLLIAGKARRIPMDAFQPGAALAVLPSEAIQVCARTDASGEFRLPLPGLTAPVQVQALVLPSGAGFSALEASEHLELGGR